MKRLLLATSFAALLLSTSAAMADDHRDDHHKGRHHQADSRDRHDHRHDDRRDDDRYERRGDYRHDNGRHLGWQKQAFRRGQRVPVVYLEPRYYVRDYRAYDLAPPQPGYRWVRPEDGRYLLVQTATGVIAQLLGY